MNGLTSIVAVGLDGEIGVDNGLPWRLKSDLRFFKRTTSDNLIVMGRKTFESIGGCLPGRENIVLSHRATLFEDHDGCHHSHSVAEALFVRAKFARKQAYIIGGAQTYREFSPYVDRYLITVVKSRFPDADAFFDQSIFGDMDDWSKHPIEVQRIETEGADEFDFDVIELRHKRPSSIKAARAEAIARFEAKNHLLQRKAHQKRAQKGEGLDQISSWA